MPDGNFTVFENWASVKYLERLNILHSAYSIYSNRYRQIVHFGANFWPCNFEFWLKTYSKFRKLKYKYKFCSAEINFEKVSFRFEDYLFDSEMIFQNAIFVFCSSTLPSFSLNMNLKISKLILLIQRLSRPYIKFTLHC